MKELIRKLLFPLAVLNDGYFYAKEGTLLANFFKWLYEGKDDSDASEQNYL